MTIRPGGINTDILSYSANSVWQKGKKAKTEGKEQPQAQDKDLQKTPGAKQISKHLVNTNRLSLEVDKDLHIVIAKIIDKESGEVITQIPPSQRIALMKYTKEHPLPALKPGSILNKQV